MYNGLLQDIEEELMQSDINIGGYIHLEQLKDKSYNI